MTENKRPWTADVEAGKLFGGGWALFEVERSTSHKRKFRLDDNKNGGFSEADARLFAAADGMYEALEASLEAVKAFQMICTMQGVTGVADDMDKLGDRISAQLRAANPDAFDADSEGE